MDGMRSTMCLVADIHTISPRALMMAMVMMMMMAMFIDGCTRHPTAMEAARMVPLHHDDKVRGFPRRLVQQAFGSFGRRGLRCGAAARVTIALQGLLYAFFYLQGGKGVPKERALTPRRRRQECSSSLFHPCALFPGGARAVRTVAAAASSHVELEPPMGAFGSAGSSSHCCSQHCLLAVEDLRVSRTF